MTIHRPVWGLNQTLRAPAVVPAGQDTAGENTHFDLAAAGADAAQIHVDVPLGSATEIRLDAFSSVDGGVTLARETFFTRSVRSSTSFEFLVVNVPWISLVVANVAGGNSGLIGLTYAWRQWSSVPT